MPGPELTVDVAAFSRALEHALATGFVDLVARAAGDEIGRTIRERLSGVEVVARTAPPDLDELAAMAMQGAMANPEVLARLEDVPRERFVENVAGLSYEVAIALRAEGQRRALAALPREWWCPHCRRVVDPTEVTHDERHEACGAPCGDPPYQAAPAAAAPSPETTR